MKFGRFRWSLFPVPRKANPSAHLPVFFFQSLFLISWKALLWQNFCPLCHDQMRRSLQPKQVLVWPEIGLHVRTELQNTLQERKRLGWCVINNVAGDLQRKFPAGGHGGQGEKGGHGLVQQELNAMHHPQASLDLALHLFVYNFTIFLSFNNKFLFSLFKVGLRSN